MIRLIRQTADQSPGQNLLIFCPTGWLCLDRTAAAVAREEFDAFSNRIDSHANSRSSLSGQGHDATGAISPEIY